MSVTSRFMIWSAVAMSLAIAPGCSSKKKRLEPLQAPSWRIDLPVSGFGPASVALPLGASTPRPIVVVLHGEQDRADWQCGSFRGVVGARAFVVCPQGQSRAGGGRFGWGSIEDTASELRAALAALKTRFEGHVAASPIVLIGFGAGAEQAAELARQEPSFFARVALVAGNPSAFTPSAANIFAHGRGKRVLFFCTDLSCQQDGFMRATLLTRAGAGSKSVQRAVGPYLDQAFTDALKGDVAWLVEGDDRFGKPRR